MGEKPTWTFCSTQYLVDFLIFYFSNQEKWYHKIFELKISKGRNVCGFYLNTFMFLTAEYVNVVGT